MINIREHDNYSFRNTIRAGCIHECWLFFNELAKMICAEADGMLTDSLKRACAVWWKYFEIRYQGMAG